MKEVTIEYAREHLTDLMNEVNATHQPIQIRGTQMTKDAVMIGQHDWDDIQAKLRAWKTVAPDAGQTETDNQ